MSVKTYVSRWQKLLPETPLASYFFVTRLGIPKVTRYLLSYDNRARKRFTIFSQALRAFETRRCLLDPVLTARQGGAR